MSGPATLKDLKELRSAPSGRVEQERARRRRREDTSLGRLMPLSIAGDLDPNYVYRWINDNPGRVQQLTQADDWDIVTDLESGAKDKGVGTALERTVDKRTGMRAILVRKPKEYYAADKAKEQAAIAATEQTIRGGGSTSPEGLSGPQSYVPAGGISIQHGGKTSSYNP